MCSMELMECAMTTFDGSASRCVVCFSSRRRHTIFDCDWSSDVCSSDLEKAPKPGQTANCEYSSTPVFCGPRGYPHGQHCLYRNNGDGTFIDVSAVSGVAGVRTRDRKSVG